MIMTMDIGGTKTLCTFWEDGRPAERQRIPTASIDDLGRLISQLACGRTVECLCIAAAGPVHRQTVELTGTGLRIDRDSLKNALPQIPTIILMNDLAAVGYALPAIATGQLLSLKEGSPQKGAKAVLSLGTGLGVCVITPVGEVLPSEGGHMDFAPGDLRQQQICDTLHKQYGRLSCERLLSGQGLANIYGALTGAWGLSPAQITDKAFKQEPDAMETMTVFSQILGSACGNFGLIFMASGGIYLSGGILPKIHPLLDQNAFLNAFLDKGRVRDLLEEIPIRLILDETAPSLGAALYAARLSATV